MNLKFTPKTPFSIYFVGKYKRGYPKKKKRLSGGIEP